MQKRRTKVAFFTKDLSIGGIEKVFLEYANALANYDYEVLYIVLRKTGSLQNQLSNEVKIIELEADWLRQVVFKLARILKNEGIDFLISGAERENTVSIISGLIVGNKTKIVTSQHNYMDIEASPLLHKYILPWVLKHSYYTFAVSNGIREMLLKMGLDKMKVDVLYNPINIHQIRQKAQEECESLPSKYLVYVGRFYPVKNLPMLLKAFHIFHNRHRDYYLVMVGDGRQINELKLLTKELNIQDSVRWIGAKSNPYPYIKHCSLLVMSSMSESFSNVVIEALCLGKTVVSTPCKGPQETLRAPEYGYITKNLDDEKEFADLMEYAIVSPLSEEKLMCYSEKYDKNYSVKKLIKILH